MLFCKQFLRNRYLNNPQFTQKSVNVKVDLSLSLTFSLHDFYNLIAFVAIELSIYLSKALPPLSS